MPKTASTSLMYTLRDCTGLATYPHIEIVGYEGDPKEYSEIAKYHKSIYLKKASFYEELAENRKFIYRDHVLPEKGGLKFLSSIKCPVCVLYRNPEHILDNYLRTAAVGDPEKLKEELKDIYKNYICLKLNPNVLLVSYRELVTNPKNTIRNILKHFGIKAIKRISLQKRKYTGEGVKRL